MAISADHLRAGVDYPGDLSDFDEFFRDDGASVRNLERLRWLAGFVCPKCGVAAAPSCMGGGSFAVEGALREPPSRRLRSSRVKMKAVKGWLEVHPRVAIHSAPAYSSSLNQVEIWFAKMQQALIERGIFTSTADLRRKILSHVRLHKRNCRPFI